MKFEKIKINNEYRTSRLSQAGEFTIIGSSSRVNRFALIKSTGFENNDATKL